MLAERAYAKINLTLNVLGKRPDGYHDVEMVMQTIDLSDLIWLEEKSGQDVEIESSASNIPLDSRNLAVAAAQAFKEYTGLNKGLHIRIDKQIPVAAGLGGGSSDAAAVLRGLNRLWQTGLSLDQLAEVGASIGSDVPFCVYGGCAIARGRGEKIASVSHSLKAWTVLIRPSVYVSTADVYGSLSADDYDGRFETDRATNQMVKALVQKDFEGVRHGVVNRLAPTTLKLYPVVSSLQQRVEHIARAPVFMSGSGPTLFCLVPSRFAAQRIYNSLRGFSREVYLSRFV